ncbi:MAG: phosphoesterase PA-phosphatase [Solirubrobacterales bacterium]|nr:MAG: phosphoesterase PA-phosphatase [Solirubrobacterales bacterium]PZS12217.1 MAG: phosphoesterase PA-phosphatase [Solirubrobacterales bacterium]
MRMLHASRRTVIAVSLYVTASAALVVVFGVPYQRDILAVWLLLGLLCFSLADLRGYARGVMLEWLPFIAILIAYDSLRGTAGHLFAVHYLPQLQVDTALFGGTTPTVALQHWLWHGHVVWYDLVFWSVYLTHFFVTPVLATILWKVDRQRFRTFAVLVATLSFAGLITYALYPAAPPWMASQAHLIAPVARVIPAVWHSLSLHSAGSLIENGYQYANNVAAVPSLHTAFALLIAITLWPRKRKWLRPLVALYPLAMALALIYTGEHYFSDVALGWIYAIVAVLAGRALMRWWSSRQSQAGRPVPARKPAPAPEATSPEPAYAEASGGA